MRELLISILIVAILHSGSSARVDAVSEIRNPPTQGSSNRDPLSEFDRLRIDGFNAVYNIDYKTAREKFFQMTRLESEHPAGYVYLANNLWLETLYQAHRLTTSVYTGESFYSQEATEDKVDQKRDREFNDLIRQAIAASKARLIRDPKDVEALYYQASALGIRAAYGASVKRSFVRGIGDANESVKLQREVIKLDAHYVDAYLSIGFYEYVIDSLPAGWRLLARFAGLKGSKSKGIEHLGLVTTKGKYAADDARVVLLGIYSKENQPERALEIVSYMARQYPRNFLFGVERASMLYRMGRGDDGAQAFTDLLKNSFIADQAVDLVNFEWGQALSSKQNYEGALARYKEVQRWSKSNAGLVSMAHLRAGEALDALGRREEAIAEYQLVLKRENVFDSHKLALQYVKKPFVAAKS